MAPLNIVALVSGGKDSVYSILHCLSQGHRVIALANLSPPSAPPSPSLSGAAIDDLPDLNSFMFQTAGYSLIPLYSQCLPHIPLHRRAIAGDAVTTAREYAPAAADETEDMLTLLRSVLDEHPSANAVCSGAILSTYQRTRVESVAVRLGLVPLAFLWQYPVLPFPSSSSPSESTAVETAEPAALLRHMAAAGVDARIIKVASGGLDERFLWANLCDERTIARVEKAVGRFGGSVLGEGGEFETLVVKGPKAMWRKRIVVEESEMKVVKGEGGEAWLSFNDGRCEDLEDETEGEHDEIVDPARPALFDKNFQDMRKELSQYAEDVTNDVDSVANFITPHALQSTLLSSIKRSGQVLTFSNLTSSADFISEQTTAVFESLNSALHQHDLSSTSLVHILVVLRRMSDFAAFNAAYISGISSAPLPPSRVTIANGSVLPDGCDIMLSAVAMTNKTPPRHGLHVQSRSFWAPANIGPYSQTRHLLAYRGSQRHREEQTEHDIESKTLGGAALVYVAGQIPLVPATMEPLDPSSADEPVLKTFATRAALALQHLWRIGLEQEVGFWTGAVAYIARSDSFQHRARIAGQAWLIANRQGSQPNKTGDEDEDGDIDVWDRTHLGQPSWATAAQQEEPQRALPDWSRVKCGSHGGGEQESGGPVTLPSFVAVEVDELPRGCEIEWQSHGFRAGRDKRITYHVDTEGESGEERDHHINISMRIRSENYSEEEETIFPHVRTRVMSADCTAEEVKKEVERVRLGVETGDSMWTVYAAGQHVAEWQATGACVVPCRRMCRHDGAEIAAMVQRLQCR